MHLRHELEDNRKRLKELTQTIEEFDVMIKKMQPTDEHYRDVYNMRADRIIQKNNTKAAIERLSAAIDANT